MITLLMIGGGVALILFGVGHLRSGLDRLFGSRLESTVQTLAHTRLRAFATGLGVSIVAPSSTTISMLGVQTVQSGRLSARQGLAIMLGADIGLTLTVQLLALNVEQYAPILVLLGVAMSQFMDGSRARGIGQSILSLGIVFIGIKIIKDSAGAITVDGDLETLLLLSKAHPLIMAGLAAILTMILQSSTATIALLIGIVSGTDIEIPLQTAIVWVVGANLGVACTTIVLGWKQIESRRLAFGNFLVKAMMAVLVFVTLPTLADYVQNIPGEYAQRIAHTHTGFNVALAILALPLVVVISRCVELLVPERRIQTREFGPRYIDIHSTPDSVPLALGQSRQEILHMSELVREMLVDLWAGMKQGDERLIQLVADRDDRVDLLDEQVKRFLTKLVSSITNENDAAEQMRQLRYASELETIGDIIDKNLSELALKKISMQAEFSPEGTQEIDDFFGKVLENMNIAEAAFATRDVNLAKQLLRHKDRLGNYYRELRDRHFTRLNAGAEAAHETSAIHLDLLTHLRRINSAVSHVSFVILLTPEPVN